MELTQCHNRRQQVSLDYCGNQLCASTQFPHPQKNQLIDLQEYLERYCNVLAVFSFNSSENDPKIIRSFLLHILLNERDIRPTVIKKANQLISFKFGEIHLLDILNVIGGAKSLESFLKAFKTSEKKSFFTYEWFDNPDKMQNTKLPPYDVYYIELRSCSSWSRIQQLLKR